MVKVEYPDGPDPYGEIVEGKLKPGEGINTFPPERDEYLDFTGTLGKGAETITGLMFQLPKWGFERWRIEEWIEVTPVFQQQYQLTIMQKQQIEQQIKGGLASASQAVADLELVSHDFRKYREFVDFFTMIDKGNKLIKENKKEEGEKLRNRGEQTLKSIFIDQVDIHTGEGVALRSIASRWPTIIADFMQLKDGDIDFKKIAKDYKVSEAEGVILATKNKLYTEWRDRLFRQTVEDRYRTLVSLVQARKKSVDEYKNMLRPLMARYKMLSEGLAEKEPRQAMRKLSFWRPESQAMSSDFVKIWAWKPVAFAEKYKGTRQNPLDEIPLAQAGFLPDEIEILKKPKEEGGLGKEVVKALPVEPSIDSVFRKIAKSVEEQYKIEFTPKDWQDARKMMMDRFETSAKATSSYEPWVWSPYFVFLEIPFMRSVMKSPSGAEMENIFCENFKAAAQTQNIILGHYLELVARDKQLDNYISQMLGEAGAKGETIDQLIKELEWKTEEEKKETTEKNKTAEIQKKIGQAKGQAKAVRVGVGKTLEAFGIKSAFLRGEGPYELAFRDRVPKYFMPEVAEAYNAVINYLKAAYQVPGSRFL
jgi:chaperonin cofactor prefoldin